MSNKTIIYNQARKKYYDGKSTTEFDFDTTVKTAEEFANQKELLNSLYDTAPLNSPREGDVYTLTYVGKNQESLIRHIIPDSTFSTIV